MKYEVQLRSLNGFCPNFEFKILNLFVIGENSDFSGQQFFKNRNQNFSQQSTQFSQQSIDDFLKVSLVGKSECVCCRIKKVWFWIAEFVFDSNFAKHLTGPYSFLSDLKEILQNQLFLGCCNTRSAMHSTYLKGVSFVLPYSPKNKKSYPHRYVQESSRNQISISEDERIC